MAGSVRQSSWRAAAVAVFSLLACAAVPQAGRAQSAPTTVMASSLNPSQYGQSVTFTALIAGNGNGAPSGTVQFMSGPTALGDAVTVNTLGAGYPIAGGSQHTCAVTVAGGVKCWGFNYYGELGNGANGGTFNANPTPLDTGLSHVVAVAAGAYHSCALTATGRVSCWGYNNNGQLGSDPNVVGTSHSAPLDTGLTGIAALGAGYAHTCAVTAGGGVKCWGGNTYGQLGVDTGGESSSTPLDTGLAGVVALSAGTNHSCALTATGGVTCWGFGGNGQVGDLSNLTGVVAIASGTNHNCALTASGGVKCWGYNAAGQLGNNSTTSSNTPVDVSGLTSGVVAIAAGGDHTCALTAAGRVACWGANVDGQLGTDPNVASSSATPLDTGLSGIVAIAAGVSQTCALTAAGAAKCWGLNNFGELGNDPGVVGQASSTPVDVNDFGDDAAQLLGIARLSTAALAAGTHSVTAVYTSDDPNSHGNNVASPITQNVNTADQTISFTSTAPSSPAVGATYAPAANASSGLTVVLGVTGGCSFDGTTVTFTAAGACTVTADQSGSANYNAAPQATQSITVAQTTPTVGLDVSPNPSAVGQSVTFTATVGGDGYNAATGSVTFMDGSAILGSGTLSGTHASIATAALAAGSHSITAVYDGDGNFTTSMSGPASLTVNKGATTMTASASPLTVKPGAAVTLKAKLRVTAPATASPSGQVTFKDGSVTLGAATIASGGAQLTATSTTIGTHIVTASYAGDANLVGSTASASFKVSAAVGPETRVNTTTAGSQQLPAVAALKSGYAAVWASNAQDGSSFGIYLQRYSAAGAKLGSETLVNTTTKGSQTQPRIAGLKNGRFVVVWQSAGEDKSGFGIYGQMFTAAGVKVGAAFKVNTTTAQDQT
ncbi:MAG TPA: Ig-like domain repeat protein, partial [Pseudolabrys sp.]|nr:Ig-like domain repeat protein [Pseudolabrys sp.]